MFKLSFGVLKRNSDRRRSFFAQITGYAPVLALSACRRKDETSKRGTASDRFAERLPIGVQGLVNREVVIILESPAGANPEIDVADLDVERINEHVLGDRCGCSVLLRQDQTDLLVAGSAEIREAVATVAVRVRSVNHLAIVAEQLAIDVADAVIAGMTLLGILTDGVAGVTAGGLKLVNSLRSASAETLLSNEYYRLLYRKEPLPMENSGPHQRLEPGRTAFLFDLDGTLVDSVYQHVLAWRVAMLEVGIDLAVWTIHRRIGMSGGLMANAILRETGQSVTPEKARRLHDLHKQAYARLSGKVRPLPGAKQLLTYLTEARVPWAIATSGRLESAGPTLEALEVPASVPVITRDQVSHAKPDPDLFLAAAQRLGVSMSDSVVVGDSVWDLLAARRARALGVGLLAGGYGQDELERAGAYRVYHDPADLLRHLDEVGVRAGD